MIKKHKQNKNKTIKKKQKGGAEKINSYMLFALFDDEIKTKLANIMKEVQTKYSQHLLSNTHIDPHLTIFYGPKIIDKEQLITEYNREKIDETFGGFVSKFNKKLPDIKFKNVSVFKISDKNVIKIQFISIILNKMRKYLYDYFLDIEGNNLVTDFYRKSKKK
jgi:hypothetical protein